MAGNRHAGAYEMYKARGDLGEPQWPDTTLRELLKLALQGPDDRPRRSSRLRSSTAKI